MKAFKNDIDRIYSTMKDVSHDVKSQNNEIILLRVAFGRLETEMKIRSGIWGLVAGAIPVAIMLAINFLKGR